MMILPTNNKRKLYLNKYNTKYYYSTISKQIEDKLDAIILLILQNKRNEYVHQPQTKAQTKTKQTIQQNETKQDIKQYI